MRKAICISIIVALLIGLGIGEELFIQNVIRNLQSYSSSLDILIEENKADINVSAVTDELNKLEKFWDDSERPLTYFVNFERIRPIKESIVKIKGAIEQNDLSVAVENIKLLINYSNNLEFVVGANIKNIL